MLFKTHHPQDIRAQFREALRSGKLLRFPGAYSPIIAMVIERIGFEGVYVSGAVMANDLGYPDIGLVGLEHIATRSGQIARVTKLPVLADIDTGFGGSMNVARTIQLMEEAGLAGVHMEDQQSPKRCGHLANKELIDTETMVQKIHAALEAKRDKNFLVMVRSDARSVEGLDKMIERVQAYERAGAEAIFSEALKNEAEFIQMRKAVKVPLLANMTEFGQTDLMHVDDLERIGYNMVIYPVTTQRLAIKNTEDGLKELFNAGTQEGILDKMQNRKELYELVRYEDYKVFDENVYNIGQINEGKKK